MHGSSQEIRRREVRRAMKRASALPLATAAGIVAWLLDALVQSMIFHAGSYLDCLVLNVAPADWVGRLAVLVVFIILGVLLTGPAEETVTEEETPGVTVGFAQFAYEAEALIVGLDREGRITLFNRRCEEITGYAAGEAIGRSLLDDLLPARALPDMLPAFNAVIERGARFRRELPWLTNHGQEVIVSVHISPVHGDRDEIVGAVIVGEEITEYRLSEGELLVSRAPWRPLAETVMGDGLAALDAEGRITWLSASLAEMLGADRQEMLGRALAELASEGEGELVGDALERCLAGQERVAIDFGAADAEGRRIPARIALQPLESVDDEPAGAFAVIRDLSDVKPAEAEMGAAQQEMKVEIDHLRARLQDAEARVQDTRDQVQAAYEERLADAVDTARQAREAAEAEHKATVEDLSARLTAAEQRADQADEAARADQQATITELREALSQADERLTQQTSAAGELQEQLAAAEEREGELASLRGELAAAQERAVQVERDSEARLEELRAAAVAERQERVAELAAKLEAAEAETEAARERALAAQGETAQDLSAKLEAAEERVAQARSEALAESEGELASLREELDAAQERAVQVERDSEARLEELRAAAVVERQERVSKLTAKLEAAHAETEAAREDALAAQRETAQDLSAKLEAAEERVAQARETAREEFASQLSGMSARATESEELAQAARTAALAEAAEEMDALRRQFASVRAEADEAEAAAETERQAAEGLRTRLADAEGRAAEAVREAGASGEEVRALRQQLSEAEALAGDAQQASADERQRLDDQRARLAAASGEAAEARERVRAEAERADALTEELSAAGRRAEQLRAQADAERSRADEVQEQLAATEAKLEGAREAEDARRQEVEALGERLHAAEAQASELEETVAAEAEARSAREEAQSQAGELHEELAAAQARASRLEERARERVNELAEELAAAQERAGEAEQAAEAALSQADELREAVTDAEARVEAAREAAEADTQRRVREAVEEVRAEENARRDELAGQLAQAEADAAQRLREATDEHEGAVATLNAQITEAEQRIEALRAEADERAAAGAAALAEHARQIDELRGELSSAQARVEQVREELTAAHEQRVAALQTELDRTEARIEEARREGLAEQQAVVDGLRAELTEARERLEAVRQEMDARVAQAHEDALAEREAEVRALTAEVRRAETHAEELAGEAREEYARMLAHMSERVASIERQAGAEQEETLARQQEKIAELLGQLEDAEHRATDARRLAREEYEGEIARSLAEAAAVGDRIDDASVEFQAQIDLLTGQLADAERQISEARLGNDEEHRRMAESLEFLRALIDASPYPVFFTDVEGRVQACNVAFAGRVLGIPRAEAIGHTPEDLRDRVPEELIEELARNNRAVRDEGEPVTWEARVPGPDGTTRRWAFHREVYLDGDEPLGAIGAMMDISGLEVAEAALAQEREHTASVLDRAPAVIAEIQPDGTVSVVYGACEELLGWTPEELAGRDWWDTLFPGALRGQVRDVLGAMRSGGDLEDRALRLRTKSGEEHVLSWSTANVRTANRELLSILAVGHDITERASEQEALELHFHDSVERSKKLRCLSNALRLTQDPNLALVEVLSGIVASLPEAWRHPGVTTARGSVWGRERSFGESPYEPVASLIAPIVVSGESVGEIEVRYHEERPELSEGPFSIEERELLDTIARHLGETVERRSAEESLAKLRVFRHTLIEQANLWLMATDRDRNVVLWNRSAERISGYARNEVIGNDRVWEMLFPDAEYRAEIIQRLTEITFGGEAAEDWETVVLAKDGTDVIIAWNAHRLIDDEGRSIGAVAFGRDITPRRAAASNT